MKKYILFTFLIFLLAGCSFHKEEKTDLETIKSRGYLIAGVKSDSPPFGYKDTNNKLQGKDIEIAKQIAKNIFDSDITGKIQFVEVNTQNRISKLNSKEVDILCATLSINDKRKLVINFSIPYQVANQKLMVKKNSKITNIQHFNSNGKLGIVGATTAEKIIRLACPNAQIISYKTYPDIIKALKANEIDAILGDDIILKGYLSDDFKIINRTYSTEYYAVGLRKSKLSKELLDIVNATVSTVKDKKTLIKERENEKQTN